MRLEVKQVAPVSLSTPLLPAGNTPCDSSDATAVLRRFFPLQPLRYCLCLGEHSEEVLARQLAQITV
jgi:hypothetical protein